MALRIPEWSSLLASAETQLAGCGAAQHLLVDDGRDEQKHGAEITQHVLRSSVLARRCLGVHHLSLCHPWCSSTGWPPMWRPRDRFGQRDPVPGSPVAPGFDVCVVCARPTGPFESTEGPGRRRRALQKLDARLAAAGDSARQLGCREGPNCGCSVARVA